MELEKLREIIGEVLNIDPDTITADTTFVDDLGADSLDLVELMLSIEEEFDIGEIDEAEAASMKTIGDLVRRIGEDD